MVAVPIKAGLSWDLEFVSQISKNSMIKVAMNKRFIAQ